MADDLKLTYGVDLKSFERQLTSIQRQALPAAQAGYLSSLAFGARREIQDALKREIKGGPLPFTVKGVVADKAEVGKAGEAVSAVKLLPLQASYLQYPILGGVRHAGNKGASKYDVMTDAAGRDGVGNISKGFLKRTARSAKAERTRRKALREKRDALRAQGKPVSKAAWIMSATAGTSKGIFFGTVGAKDKKGYWQRTPSGGLKMLTFMTDDAKYTPSFDWNRAVEKAVTSTDARVQFSKELLRALAKLTK